MIDRRPGVIVRPRSAEAVRRAVVVAAEGGSLLAVRGGGHNVAGLSTCEGGMLLDLGLLRQVEVDRKPVRPALQVARRWPISTAPASRSVLSRQPA